MAGKPNRDGDLKGIYRRGKTFWLNATVEGKRHFVSLGTTDLAEAISKRKDIIARAALAIEEGGTLDLEIDRYVAWKQTPQAHRPWSRMTVAAQPLRLRAFATFVKNRPARTITPADIRRYYDDTLDRVAPETAKGMMTTLSGFFQWAVETARIVRTNPMEGVKIIEPQTKARLLFCTAEQRDKLIDECPRDDLKFALYCGFHAGFRKGEFTQARPQWFLPDIGKIHLFECEPQYPGDRKTELKNHKNRFIPMTKAFAEFLRGYGLPSPYMLRPEVKWGKSPYRYNIQKPYADYMKAQGMAWVTPHVMRHTFASLHLMAGASIYKVAMWLGDSVATTQKHYGKLVHEDEDIELQFKKPPTAAGEAPTPGTTEPPPLPA